MYTESIESTNTKQMHNPYTHSDATDYATAEREVYCHRCGEIGGLIRECVDEGDGVDCPPEFKTSTDCCGWDDWSNPEDVDSDPYNDPVASDRAAIARSIA